MAATLLIVFLFKSFSGAQGLHAARCTKFCKGDENCCAFSLHGGHTRMMHSQWKKDLTVKAKLATKKCHWCDTLWEPWTVTPMKWLLPRTSSS